MEKHKFPPTAEPHKEHPQRKTGDRESGGHRHNPVKIVHHEFPGAVEFMLEVPVSSTREVEIEAPATALAQVRQPRAETDREPFARIERLKQHPLHTNNRLADGEGDADQLHCHRLENSFAFNQGNVTPARLAVKVDFLEVARF